MGARVLINGTRYNATYLATIWVIPLIIAITFHEAARPHRPLLRRLLGRRVSAAREQSGRNVRGGREPATPRFSSLKVHLRPKSGNESVPSNPAHIGIVLNHRLNQQGSRKHQDVELNTVLGLPGRHAGGEKLRAKTVSHIASDMVL